MMPTAPIRETAENSVSAPNAPTKNPAARKTKANFFARFGLRCKARPPVFPEEEAISPLRTNHPFPFSFYGGATDDAAPAQR